MSSPGSGPPSNLPAMKARRPYVLRAIHEWITDSLCTPHLVVDAGMDGVEVPRQYVKEGKIVLNVSWNATANLRLGNEEVSFSGRFGGASMSVRIPITAVLAIYARETGQGMIFADDDRQPPPASAESDDDVDSRGDGPPGEGDGDRRPTDRDEPPPKPAGPKGRARLKLVK